MASTGPALGARFRGRNRSGWRRWSTSCTIVRYEAGSEIAWDVTFGPLPVARWSYRVEPGDAFGGSVVTERFEDHRGTMLRLTAPLVRGTSDADTLTAPTWRPPWPASSGGPRADRVRGAGSRW